MLYAYNDTKQSVDASGNVVFATNGVLCGRTTQHGINSAEVLLITPGIYKIDFYADVVGSGSDVVLQLYVNDGAYPGALATTGASDTENISFSTLVVIKNNCNCQCNTPIVITVRNTTATAATLTNAAITITKQG